MSEGGPVHTAWAEGDVLRVVLARPPANILDGDMVAALRAAVAEAREAPALRALVLEAEGKHFSFGASVEEHLPGSVAGMLGSLHALLRELVALRRPILGAVRGQCLGGGLELLLVAHRLFARPDAVLGQPEIQLGVFAPAASVLLPLRVGQAAADHLLLSGETVTGEAALALGLVDEIHEDPAAAALAYAARAFGRKSIAALGCAVKAARAPWERRLVDGLEQVERLYLDELMSLKDPEEGLRAFLEKRRPAWTHA